MRRILVTGSGGQVGWEMARRLIDIAEVVALDRTFLDLSNTKTIRSAMRTVSPAVVVNAAAYTAVDAAETDDEKCRVVNTVAPAVLAEEARKIGALMVHFSTDYVFDGTKDSPYVETDVPNPLGEYGRSKLEGEQAVEASRADHLIFRLCWVYSWRGKNFFKTIRRLASERDSLRVVADQAGSPTWAGTIADAVCTALRVRLAARDGENLDGIYHLAARGRATWHEFAQTIVDSMDNPRCRVVEAIMTDDFPTAARRPAFSEMSCAKLEQTFGIRLPEWREAFSEMLTAGEPEIPTQA